MTSKSERRLSVLRGAAVPARLFDLSPPPSELHVRGRLPRGPAVAIVGTRAASTPALAFARALAGDLAREGVAVLSGGAKGIDTAAHEGALDEDGTTVVVAPAGFRRPFPKENAKLFRAIVERHGAYVSLVADDVPAQRGAFFARNACLVALAHIVVVVEAGFRSGACNAAAEARRLGRPLFVVPHPPWHFKGQGCLLELKRGARVLESSKDILASLAAARLHAIPTIAAQAPPLLVAQTSLDAVAPATEDELEAVLTAVREGARNVDEICARTGLAVAGVHRQILTLSLRGVLVADRSGQLRVL